MKIESKKQLEKYFNNHYQIVIIPLTEKVIDYNLTTFVLNSENKIYSYNMHFGIIERTDKTKQDIIDFISEFINDPDYLVNVSGY